MIVRNFKEFEKGHWYLYTGIARGLFWNSQGAIYVLDHKPRQCLQAVSGYEGSFHPADIIPWN